MIEQVHRMDLVYLLGFFMAAALRRGRLDAMIGGILKYFPTEGNPGFGTGNSEKATAAQSDE